MKIDFDQLSRQFLSSHPNIDFDQLSRPLIQTYVATCNSAWVNVLSV